MSDGSGWLPWLQAEKKRWAAIDVAALDDGALAAHLDALRGHWQACWTIHMDVQVPLSVLLLGFIVWVKQKLGYSDFAAFRLVQGHDPAIAPAETALTHVA